MSAAAGCQAIAGNEIVDQLAKETLDHDVDPLATVHYADLKPVVNSYIRAEEVVITRVRISHAKPQSHTSCPEDRQLLVSIVARLTIEHMLLECTVLQQIRDEYYTVDSLRTRFETISETCVVEFLREAGFFYLI